MRNPARQFIATALATVLLAATSTAVAGPAQAATGGDLVVTVTDYTAAPLAGAKIATSVNGQNWSDAGTTAADGVLTVNNVAPGTYKVRIQAPGGLVQYVPRKIVADQATGYQVVAGQPTQVSDQLLESGNVRISVVDHITGAPVTSGCVSIGTSDSLCNHSDGQYSFAGVPWGSNSIVVNGTKTFWPAGQGVNVPAGPVDYTIQLDPAAAIQTTVQAADDPTSHPATCVLAVYRGVDAATSTNCDMDPTTGSIVIGPLASTTVQLFAVSADVFNSGTPFNPVYGAQWVGSGGGTGDQRQAVKVDVTAGTVTTIPPIRLDHAGSIVGTVDDPYYGDSGTYAWVRPFGLQDGLRNIPAPGLVDRPYVGGSYRLSGLGPYAWPVEFAGERGVYADQWSGNAPNRYAAVPVQVRAGQTTPLSAVLTYATGAVTGRMRWSETYTPSNGFWVGATSAVTGDDIGLSSVDGSSTSAAFSVTGLNADPVLLTGGVWGGSPCTSTHRIPTQGADSMGVLLTVPKVSTWPPVYSCDSFAPPRTVPPALTSTPTATYVPSTHRFDVSANAGGALVERLWDRNAGWSGLKNLGGSLAGAPTSLYNPRYGTTEVYGRSGSHVVFAYYYNGWSGWADLGGNAASDPTVLYNPRFGTTEVYVRTADNRIAYKYYYNGWSDWIDLGGNTTGNPAVLYNPKYGTTEVYTRDSAGHTVYRYYYNGWSGWNDLGGNATGNPAVLYNPKYGTTEVYVSSGGHVIEKYFVNGWSDWADLGGDVTGDPALVYNPDDASTHLYADADGYLYEKYWDSQAGHWSTWTNLSP